MTVDREKVERLCETLHGTAKHLDATGRAVCLAFLALNGQPVTEEG